MTRAVPALLLAATVCALPARAQDSFVREADFLTGRPLLSVLGSGLGTRDASLTMEFACPAAEVMSVELSGARFPDGAPISFDLGGPQDGWHGVRLVGVQRPEAERLRLQVDAASFRTALARAAQGDAAPDAAAVLQIGGELGVAVGLESLAREVAALTQDCASPRSLAGRGADAQPVARYAR